MVAWSHTHTHILHKISSENKRTRFKGIRKKSSSKNHSTPINVCKYLCAFVCAIPYRCVCVVTVHLFVILFFTHFQLQQVTIILRFLDRLRCQMARNIHSLYGPYNFRSYIYCLCAATLKFVYWFLSKAVLNFDFFFHSFHVVVSRRWNASEGEW